MVSVTRPSIRKDRNPMTENHGGLTTPNHGLTSRHMDMDVRDVRTPYHLPHSSLASTTQNTTVNPPRIAKPLNGISSGIGFRICLSLMYYRGNQSLNSIIPFIINMTHKFRIPIQA